MFSLLLISSIALDRSITQAFTPSCVTAFLKQSDTALAGFPPVSSSHVTQQSQPPSPGGFEGVLQILVQALPPILCSLTKLSHLCCGLSYYL